MIALANKSLHDNFCFNLYDVQLGNFEDNHKKNTANNRKKFFFHRDNVESLLEKRMNVIHDDFKDKGISVSIEYKKINIDGTIAQSHCQHNEESNDISYKIYIDYDKLLGKDKDKFYFSEFAGLLNTLDHEVEHIFQYEKAFSSQENSPYLDKLRENIITISCFPGFYHTNDVWEKTYLERDAQFSSVPKTFDYLHTLISNGIIRSDCQQNVEESCKFLLQLSIDRFNVPNIEYDENKSFKENAKNINEEALQDLDNVPILTKISDKKNETSYIYQLAQKDSNYKELIAEIDNSDNANLKFKRLAFAIKECIPRDSLYITRKKTVSLLIDKINVVQGEQIFDTAKPERASKELDRSVLEEIIKLKKEEKERLIQEKQQKEEEEQLKNERDQQKKEESNKEQGGNELREKDQLMGKSAPDVDDYLARMESTQGNDIVHEDVREFNFEEQHHIIRDTHVESRTTPAEMPNVIGKDGATHEMTESERQERERQRERQRELKRTQQQSPANDPQKQGKAHSELKVDDNLDSEQTLKRYEVRNCSTADIAKLDRVNRDGMRINAQRMRILHNKEREQAEELARMGVFSKLLDHLIHRPGERKEDILAQTRAELQETQQNQEIMKDYMGGFAKCFQIKQAREERFAFLQKKRAMQLEKERSVEQDRGNSSAQDFGR